MADYTAEIQHALTTLYTNAPNAAYLKTYRNMFQRITEPPPPLTRIEKSNTENDLEIIRSHSALLSEYNDTLQSVGTRMYKTHSEKAMRSANLDTNSPSTSSRVAAVSSTAHLAPVNQENLVRAAAKKRHVPTLYEEKPAKKCPGPKGEKQGTPPKKNPRAKAPSFQKRGGWVKRPSQEETARFI
jgi:hypothetical protein